MLYVYCANGRERYDKQGVSYDRNSANCGRKWLGKVIESGFPRHRNEGLRRRLQQPYRRTHSEWRAYWNGMVHLNVGDLVSNG